MAAQEFDCLFGEHIGQVAAVAPGTCAVALKRAEALDPPVPVVHPAATEADKVVEAAPVGMETVVEGAVVPLADQPRGVSGVPEAVAQGHLPRMQAVEAEHLLGCDGAGAMWVAAGEQRRGPARTRAIPNSAASDTPLRR